MSIPENHDPREPTKVASLQLGRQNARRGILGPAHGRTDRSGGMKTPSAIHPNNAAKLFNHWGHLCLMATLQVPK